MTYQHAKLFLFIIGLAILGWSLFTQKAMADEKQDVDLIIQGDYILTMDRNNPLINAGALAIKGDRILAIGSEKTINQHYQAKKTLSGDNRIVMPGLINGHTHSAMTLFRGMADDLDLMTWLNQYIFPMESQFVSPEFIQTGTELACYEMIMSGTTTFVDMYFYPEVIAQVVDRCGLRAIIGAPSIDYPSPGFKGWDDSFSAAVDFVTQQQGKHPRITAAFAPHAPYTVSPKHLQAVAAASARLQAPVMMHIAEAHSETEYIHKQFSTTPVNFVAASGLFNHNLIAAHMIQLTDADIALTAKKGVGVVHNPTSNMKLGAGAAPVAKMLDAGIHVALGTDGAASNNDLDLWEEIRLAALLQKLETSNPAVLKAMTVLEMATAMGAAAIGLGQITGQLKPGMQADIIQIAFDPLQYQPLYNPASHLVYVMKSTDVRTTVVAGRILMENREIKTIDPDQLRVDVESIKKKIQTQLQLGQH